jgi:hypothetical protein
LLAQSVGYRYTFKADSLDEIKSILQGIKQLLGPIFIEIVVNSSSRNDLIRPLESPEENKGVFMGFLSE